MKLPADWSWPVPRPEQPTLHGLRKLVKRERKRREREQQARDDERLLAEAEFDAWRMDRDW